MPIGPTFDPSQLGSEEYQPEDEAAKKTGGVELADFMDWSTFSIEVAGSAGTCSALGVFGYRWL